MLGSLVQDIVTYKKSTCLPGNYRQQSEVNDSLYLQEIWYDVMASLLAELLISCNPPP